MPQLLIQTKRFGDERGWFAETYNAARMSALGIDDVFVQDNHAKSGPVGVLRGLHFQRPPFAQAKLVRCVRGRIWDVVVDIRAGSPTYGGWTGAELTEDNGLQLYVPVGFAHGYVTLDADSEVEYKVSARYAPECEGGILWNDPELAIPWPLPPSGPLTSEKDLRLSPLRDLDSPFVFDGTPLVPLEVC
jgi:dTDP-4-dehydrorhamnose 3,5-epimerase